MAKQTIAGQAGDLRRTVDRSRTETPNTKACTRCGKTGVFFRTRRRRLVSGTVEYWMSECDDCTKTRARRHASSLDEYGFTKSKGYFLKKEYGITPKEWVDLWYAQGECCGVCRSETTDGRWWHLDHDHSTGKVRGILCHGCNTGLGNFGDDIARMKRAIEYLEVHGG